VKKSLYHGFVTFYTPQDKLKKEKRWRPQN